MRDNELQGSAVLATAEQRLIEERAIGLYNSAAVRAAMDATTEYFRADRTAKLADQAPLMMQSVREHYFHSALMAASETPRAPRFIWTLALAHSWMGLDVPPSRFGQDNVDNCYRAAAVDEACRYRVTGHVVPQRPCDFSICALRRQVGDDIAADVLDIVTIDSIDVDVHGRFVLDVDATPREGRRNRLSIAGAKVLFVRDTLADWSSERPIKLHIECVDEPAQDDYEEYRAAARAAQLGATIACFFLEKIQHGIFENRPANTLGTPFPAGRKGGLTTQASANGYYALAGDEALVISADRRGARYLGMQILDRWMLSYEYSRHSSSFNHTQAVADSDGRYRLVIARDDPGAFNWLDSGGHSTGSILLRWQELPEGTDLSGLVSCEMVKLEALRSYLPPETRYLGAAERAQQRERRFSDYKQRLT